MMKDDLRNRGVVAELGGVLHPTLYGVLAFGKEHKAIRKHKTSG